jgi:deoxyribonuclease V
MKADLHSWTLDSEEAMRVQARLRDLLSLHWDGRAVHSVAGVDIGQREDQVRATIVVLRYPDLSPLEAVTAAAPLVFPYIPGLLAFCTGPAVLAAWEKLEHTPDLVMFAGQGIAHPRGIGVASQMGLWLQIPTIGVAKSRLYGQHIAVGPEPGDVVDLIDQRDPRHVIGSVLRSKVGTNPLYVSPGHLIDVPHAVKFVKGCLAGYRLPETIRWAHRIDGGEQLPML